MDAVRGMVGMSPDKSGVWGYPTSTLDWCEENYVVTPYIAEFWNTISNLVMIIPPIISTHYYWKIGMEFRYVILNVALVVVGIGSWLFHMTLQYEMQLLDELLLIYTGCFFAFVLMDGDGPPGWHVNAENAAVVGYAVFITAAYLYLQEPVLHQIAYVVIVAKLVHDSFKIGKRFPRLMPLLYSALVCFGLGLLMWIIDYMLCPFLRDARASSYIAPLFQTHAWWHIFAGYGTFLHIVFISWSRLLFHRRPYSVKFVGIHPYLVIRRMNED